MKIKCPYCKCEITTDNNEKARWWIGEHLRNHDLHYLRITLADLTFKIHEKIESLQKENEEYEAELNDGATLLANDIEIKALKSLLEK